MVNIRGANVYQTAVENVLGGIEGVSHFYQMIITQIEGNDRMLVELEPEASVPAAGWDKLAAGVAEKIYRALGVRLEISVVEPNGLPRYELKTKRVIDRRPKEFRRALER